MREILFRGKREYDNEWVYGHLVIESNEQQPIIVSILTFDDYEDDEVDEQNIRDFYYYYVDPETVCQFTGLYDKNGRKIFEGDIVERGGRIWRVKYGDNYGKFMMTTYTEKGVSWDRDFDTIPPDWCEVIGNIYDNPELLEVKQNG